MAVITYTYPSDSQGLIYHALRFDRDVEDFVSFAPSAGREVLVVDHAEHTLAGRAVRAIGPGWRDEGDDTLSGPYRGETLYVGRGDGSGSLTTYRRGDTRPWYVWLDPTDQHAAELLPDS